MILALLLAAAPPVPFVGCPADGQLRPQRAPRSGAVPRAVPAAAATRLAYYSMGELGVLAPRGWHCFGLSGSDGSILFVTPARQTFATLNDEAGLRGPAVQVTLSYGGTSGRFAVAEAIARLFPAHMAFARQVAAEGIMAEPLPTGPYPGDRLIRLSPTEIAYATPGEREGLGTQNRLARGRDPVEGVVILQPGEGRDEEPNLIKLDLRLPPALAPLAPAIVAAVRRQHGPTRPG